MLTNEFALSVLNKYAKAWVNQDTDLILSIFTNDAIYHERVLEEPMRGHLKIKEYWNTKVCQEQSNINFKLLNFYIFENTIIAEWDANFFSSVKNKRVHIREVAILEIEQEKIKSLREYWHSEIIQ